MPEIALIPIDTARSLLNDDDAVSWPDFRILPKLKQAFREAVTSFQLNSIPITIETTVEMVLVQGDTILSNITAWPTNFYEVIHLKEKLPGETIGSYREMVQRDFLPLVMPDTRLVWWTLQGRDIITLGALQDVDIILQYRKKVQPPEFLTDILELPDIEDYLGYKTASLCYGSIGNQNQASYYSDKADANLEMTIDEKVRNTVQPLPAKRQGYHRKYINRNVLGV